MLARAPLVLALVWAAAGCGPRPPAGPPLRPGQDPGWIPPAVARAAVDFHGTCSWGRAPGDPARYRVKLRVRDDPSGSVVVRRDAWFDLHDPGNTLGELPVGAVVRGDGPVAAPGSPHGAGYAVLVRGHTGRVCRGYVDAASVIVIRD